MDKKKWIRWSFWPILLIILVWGYFLIGSKPVNHHLNFVPSNAKAVILIDSKTLVEDYYHLLKFHPTEIDKVLPEGDPDGEPVLPEDLPGIVPLEKICLYVISNPENPDELFRCFIATLNDSKKFLEFQNEASEKQPNKKELDGGSITHFEIGNKVVIVKDNIGIVMQPVLPGKKIKLSAGETHYNSIFGDQASPLIESSKSFKASTGREDHLTIWSGTGEGVMQGMGGDLLGFNSIFNSQLVAINLFEEGIDTKAHMYVNNKDFFIENGSAEVPLEENELAKISMTLNPEYMHTQFDQLIPEDKEFLTHGWTGKICSSIIGFRTEPIKKVSYTTVVNEETFETYLEADTTVLEIAKYVNLPHFAMGIEINNSEEISSVFNSDSTFISQDDYWYINLPQFVDEKLYLKLENKNLILSTVPITFDYAVNYTTFAFSVDIDGIFEKYPPKDFIQQMLMPEINRYEFHNFEMHYDGMQDDQLVLHGQLEMGEKQMHTLIQFVRIAYEIANRL